MASFTNQARLTYNNLVANSNVAVGELIEVLSAQKVAVPADYSQGSDVTYAISIVNTGTAPITNISVADNLGAYTVDAVSYNPLTYVDGSARAIVNGVVQTTPVTAAATATGVTFTGINVPAGGNVTILYDAVVNGFAPLDAASTITNTATVTGAGITTPVTAVADISVSDEPALTINKSISPVPVTEGSTVTYTFEIQNYGNVPADAGDNAVLSDTFNPILTNVTAAFNGTPWTAGTEYNYTEGTGLFTTVAGNILVPAATYTRNADGSYTTVPGTATLVVTGTI